MTTQTKTTWQESRIGDLLSKVKRQEKVKKSEYLERGLYPIVDQGEGQIGGYTDDEEYLYDGDLPVTVFGDHTRRFKWIDFPFAVGADGTQILIPKDNFDKRFFYYALKGAYLKNYGYQRHFKYLKDTKISFPTPKETQESIADILGTYDDLIENNTKRIKILEEIAQAIYREWFENNSRIKMQNAKLSEVVKPQYGYTESASEEKIGPKYLRGTDINKNSYVDWSVVPYCKISDEDKNKYQLQKNDIVVIRMADPGKIGMVEQDVDAVFASYLIRLKIVDERISPYYLFYFLNSDQYQNYIQGASGGTTRKSASAGVVTGTEIPIHPKDLVNKFEEKISLLRSELNNLLIQNAKLRQARDLLLPKLVTGEIEVK